MSRFLLAGGGTAGHVNPMLATADELVSLGHEVACLGTASGLEAQLVPQRGYQLHTIARLPLPRKPSIAAIQFPFRFLLTVGKIRKLLKQFDAMIGFGGYVSAPAYLAAALSRKPFVVHEANALAGFANRLGAKLTKNVAVSFPDSALDGELTGMPLRKEIIEAASYDRMQARVELGLEPQTPTLLVTGGSLGAKRINDAVIESIDVLQAAGVQVYHIVGNSSGLADESRNGYQRVSYCQRMDLAIRASDFAISRAGASTVSEFMALGLPAVYVPYPVGNGEQRFNVAALAESGGSLVVNDSDFDASYISSSLIPLLSSSKKLEEMRQIVASMANVDASKKLAAMAIGVVS